MLRARRATIPATFVAVALLTACGAGGDETIAPSPDAATTPGELELTTIGEFEQPLFVTQPESDPGHLYVVEQCGRVERVPAAGGEPETFLDVSGLVSCGGEQGLLSVAFAPDYERSGKLYVYYTDAEGTTRIVEYTRGADGAADPASARELLSIEDFAPNHNGGLLLFEDGLLHIGTGDGGGAGDPERNGQDLQSLLGKILRIDPEAPGARPEVLAYGLRNPWRYSFDRETGDLWIGDVGQSELEEVDAARAADVGRRRLNFGWSAFEGTERFNADEEAPGARAPVLEYGRNRGCSITGGYVVRDPALASLEGRYLYGDYCAGELRSFDAARALDGEAADDRALGLHVPQLSSFGEDAAGHLYATSLEGPVYRLDAR